MLDIRLLIERGVWAAAAQVVDETISTADTYELFTERMQLNAYIRILLYRPDVVIHYTLHELEENDRVQLRHIQQMAMAESCNSKLIVFLQQPPAFRKESDIADVVKHAEQAHRDASTSTRVLIKCFNALGMYYQHTGQYESLYRLCREWMQRCYNRPHPMLVDTGRMMKVYRNFLTSCVYMERWDEMPPL